MKYLFRFGILIVGAMGVLAYQSKQKNTYEGPLIDVHTHIDFDGKIDDAGFANTREAYLAQLKEAGAVAAVAHSPRSGKLTTAFKEFPVIQCLAVTNHRSLTLAEALLANHRFQCLKIYLGYQYRWASDDFYKSFYRLAEKYHVPVVFHTGDTYDVNGKLKYADPLTIDEVAVEFRKVNFVIAHLGNPWIQSAAEVAYKNPNVYLEVSALLIGDLTKADPEKINEYVVKPIAWTFGYLENPSKLMFGTDWSLVNIKVYRDIVAKAIPQEHWKAVFHDNAAHVFKISLPVAPQR